MNEPKRTRDHVSAPVTPRDHVVRLSFAEAAERLGITVGAVRMRVHRGSLKSEHDGGERFVLVPAALLDAAARRDERETHASARVITADDRDALLAAKDSEIAYLRQSLDDEREARRRADLIVLELTRNLAALPATTVETAAAEPAVTRSERPGRTESAATASDTPRPAASLWGRFLRWYRSHDG